MLNAKLEVVGVAFQKGQDAENTYVGLPFGDSTHLLAMTPPTTCHLSLIPCEARLPTLSAFNLTLPVYPQVFVGCGVSCVYALCLLFMACVCCVCFVCMCVSMRLLIYPCLVCVVAVGISSPSRWWSGFWRTTRDTAR